MLRYLATASFPAVRQRRTVAGDPFVEHGGNFWAAFDYIDGHLAVPPSESQLIALACVQAQLHNVLAIFPEAARYATFAGSFRPRKTWAYMVPLGDSLKFLDMMQAHGDLVQLSGHPLAGGIQEHLQTCRQRISRIVQRLPRLAGMLTHNDYGQFNVLFGADGRTTVIDFDLLSWEPAAANLARAINVVARPQWMGPFEPAKMIVYVDAYQTERPLGDDERQALPDLLRLFVLQYVIFHGVLCIQERDPSSQSRFMQAMQDDLCRDAELVDLLGSER